MRDCLVYLAGPITASHGRTVEGNIANALDWYWTCIRSGIPAFCAHLSASFPTAYSINYPIWIEYDFAMIRRCTHVLMLPHWEQSSGAVQEKEYADVIGKPVFYSLAALANSLNSVDVIPPPHVPPSVHTSPSRERYLAKQSDHDQQSDR